MMIHVDSYKVEHSQQYPESRYRCETHLHRPDDCHEHCEYRQPDSYDALMAHLRSKYGEPIGEGRHRITFASKRVVVKMPKNIGAITASQCEYSMFKNSNGDERLARCRMIWLFNVPVIIMEKLDIDIDYRSKPDWAWNYDSGQVGKDRKGNIKAYDYTY